MSVVELGSLITLIFLPFNFVILVLQLVAAVVIGKKMYHKPVFVVYDETATSEDTDSKVNRDRLEV